MSVNITELATIWNACMHYKHMHPLSQFCIELNAAIVAPEAGTTCIIVGKGPLLERGGGWNENNYTCYVTFDRDNPQFSQDVGRTLEQ